MRLFRRRAVAQGDEPPPDIAEWLAYDETLAGGYIFTADPQAPPMTLTAPLITRSTTFEVSVPPDELPAGQYYLLGGPEEPTCEVVQVEVGEAEPGRPRRIRRCRFDTIGWRHPAGTLVAPVTVSRVPGLPPPAL